MGYDMSLTAVSPLDGRYHQQCAELSTLVSEYGLMRYRWVVEIRWLQTLSAIPAIKEVPPFSPSATAFLSLLIDNFNKSDATHIKSLEETTNHDLKALEYVLKEKLSSHDELSKAREFVHFACTSEDI